MSARVLIVDDAIFMRSVIRDILERGGYTVCGEADTGLKAVDMYKQLEPDFVTMDIVMPELDGIEAVRRIIEHDPNARILMCSAMGQQSLVIEAIQAGAKDYVIKPFQASRVLAAVQRVLS